MAKRLRWFARTDDGAPTAYLGAKRELVAATLRDWLMAGLDARQVEDGPLRIEVECRLMSDDEVELFQG